jgi:hypothetical protein
MPLEASYQQQLLGFSLWTVLQCGFVMHYTQQMEQQALLSAPVGDMPTGAARLGDRSWHVDQSWTG